jgi:serine/arginine repetitive matrix protein 2
MQDPGDVQLDVIAADIPADDADMTDEELYRPPTPAEPFEGIPRSRSVTLHIEPPFRPDTPAYPLEEEGRVAEGEQNVGVQEEEVRTVAVPLDQPLQQTGSPPEESTAPHQAKTSPILVPESDKANATPPPTSQPVELDLSVTPLQPLVPSSLVDNVIIRSEVVAIQPETPVLHVDPTSTQQITIPLSEKTTKALDGSVVRRVTIAERRAVDLPASGGVLSSPFGEKFPRRDPNPTVESVREGSTDTEGDVISTYQYEALQDVDEDVRRDNIVKAVKENQELPLALDLDPIIAWNVSVGPPTSTRAVLKLSPRGREREINQPVRGHSRVAKLVAEVIKRENIEAEEKIASIRAEYLELDADWREQIKFLDRTMEKRGAAPRAYYSAPPELEESDPATILNAMAAPLAPATPIDEAFPTRTNRRRGVTAGDGVLSEATYQEMLGAMQATLARQPEERAKRTTAKVPDMIPVLERSVIFDDENDLVTDPLAFYDFQGVAEPIWTEHERALFLKRYLAWPKEFGKISSGIPGKSAEECVAYYYRTKKKVGYKDLVHKRSGDRKKKGEPDKKSGKSSALLSDLNRLKPAIIPPKPPSTARNDTKGEEEAGIVDQILERSGLSAFIPQTRRPVTATSRNDMPNVVPPTVGNESPSISKLKMRMNVKVGATPAKRPRVSSLAGTETASIGSPVEDLPINPPLDPGDPATPVQPDLLPPVKRSTKRQKRVDGPGDSISTPSSQIDDPLNNPPSQAGPSNNRPSRRNATNSYWSIAEKDRLKELVAVHGTNVRVIAKIMGGKTERQIANFYEAHRDDMGLDDLARNVPPSTVNVEEERVSFYGFRTVPLPLLTLMGIVDQDGLWSTRAIRSFDIRCAAFCDVSFIGRV